MKEAEDIDLRLEDIPFNPELRNKKITRGYSLDDIPVYLVYVSLSGKDLNKIRKVEFLNYSGIIEENRCIEWNSNNKSFLTKLWTPHAFLLKAIAYDLNGNEYPLKHYLEFEKYFDPVLSREENIKIFDFQK